ncbi:MAG: hypothetical protein DDT32_00926 [Syntrophomonadaceae bacterium]|nr:hypothetical protein [Bacillota bacterium]
MDKTGCIKVAGNLYEVDLELVGFKVLLRYDPFDLSVIHVWHNKKRYDNAGPVDQTLHYHGRVKPEKPQKQPVNSEEFSFFRAVKQRRRFRVIPGATNICTGNSCARWARCRLSFLAKAKRLWSDALEARSEQGDKSLVVVVDEVQEMTKTMLVELRFAVNHQLDSSSLFPLILVGQSELRRTLRLKKYEAVAQRIPMQYHLGGLTPEETKAYIRHQMQSAHLTTPVFAESTMAQIHAASQGIPGLLT